MNDITRLALRLLLSVVLSVLIGGLVWLFTTFIAWQNVRNSDGARPKQWETQNVIMADVNEAILNYENTTGLLPQSLDDLKETSPDKFDANGAWVDAWKRPLTSLFDGTWLRVTSYGRDGKPGGVGLDHDLNNIDPEPLEARLTYSQFLSHKSTKTARKWCMHLSIYLFVVVCIIVFMLVMIAPKLSDQAKALIVSSAISMAIVVVSASLIGGMISLLHIPVLPSNTPHQASGH